VKTFAKNNYSKPAPVDDSVIIEIDEMWHFLRSKKDEFGSGRPTANPKNSWECWLNNYIDRFIDMEGCIKKHR